MAADVIANRYRILREVGRGGMGVVYHAQHTNTGESVALKVLLAHTGAQADMLERFKREMRAPALIRSEHVVRVTDADVAPELGGALFLVMELLNGSDLERVLQKRGPFSPEEVVWLLSQAARGLDRAHAVGVIHRDLKPENLFLHRREGGGYIVKLLDFGIARLTDRDSVGAASAKVTATGAILGTPMYLSPEQAMSESESIGPQSDVWSIGLIAFELLVGHPYFQGEGVAKLIGQICFAPLPAASARGAGLSPAFDRWFEGCVNRDASRRFTTVGAQVAALAEALGIPASVAQSNDAPSGLAEWMQRQGSEAAAAPPGPVDTSGLDLSRPLVGAGREGRTTTSEGRGQTTLRHIPRRAMLATAGGLLLVGVLVWWARPAGERGKPHATAARSGAAAARGAQPAGTAEEVDGGVAAEAPTSPAAGAAAANRVAPHGAAAKGIKEPPRGGRKRPAGPTKRPGVTGATSYDPVAP